MWKKIWNKIKIDFTERTILMVIDIISRLLWLGLVILLILIINDVIQNYGSLS